MTPPRRGKTRSCPGCGCLIWPGDYACPRDWNRLPPGHRTSILRAWGRRTRGVKDADREHEEAKAAADQWLRHNTTTTERTTT